MLSDKIAVLYGGPTPERDLSINTAKNINSALLRLGYQEPLMIDIDTTFARNVSSYDMDIAVIAIQGRYGEDGCLQGLLECAGIPYTHSGVLASSLGMNKHLCALLFKSIGIPHPEYILWNASHSTTPHWNLPYPCIIKPIENGSSHGTILIRDKSQFHSHHWDDIKQNLMISSYIPGQELTVGVMDNKAIGVLEITNFGNVFGHHHKYTSQDTQWLYPARVPEKIQSLAMKYAEEAHRILGCTGITRSDFRYNNITDELFILEINTNPGLSDRSMMPKIAAHSGISFDDMISFLLNEARSSEYYRQQK